MISLGDFEEKKIDFFHFFFIFYFFGQEKFGSQGHTALYRGQRYNEERYNGARVYHNTTMIKNHT